jgi:hypothetical protein
LPGRVDEARAFPRLPEKLLHDIVVRLGPEPAFLQLPSIDDVTDEIDRLGVVTAQEVEQEERLATLGSKVHVGDEIARKLRGPGSPSAMRMLPCLPDTTNLIPISVS